MREKVTFEINVPQVLALDPQFPKGKPVEGRYGDQVMFYLTQNRVAYLEPEVAEQIQALNIQPGEEFVVVKRQVRDGNRRWLEWKVERLEAEPVNGKPQPVNGKPQTPANGKPAGIGPMSEITHAQEAAKVDYATALTAFLIIALQAAQKAEQWAAANNCSVRFTSQDVQGLASTLFIQAAREGWLTWRA